MKSPELKIFERLVSEHYGLSARNYGEAHEVIKEDEGANYRVIDEETPCSTDDNFDLVLFYIKTDATANDNPSQGMRQTMSRDVNYTLVGNCKNANGEKNLAVFLNKSGLEYQNSNFDGKRIAQQYFGLTEHNFETYFFTIDFQGQESIECDCCETAII